MGYIFTHWVKALFFRDIDFVVGTNAISDLCKSVKVVDKSDVSGVPNALSECPKVYPLTLLHLSPKL
jgi:hypothetical protein